MTLYEEGSGCIWTDPYIREQLLLAHLDAETDAASRAPVVIDATIEWMLRAADGPGRVVDLGCGPGLYAERLATRGWDVLGIDLNAASLTHARSSAAEKGLALRYVEGSYLAPFTTERFDLGICVYCDVGALPVPQRDRFFRITADLIQTGGTLIFDVFGPGLSRIMNVGHSSTRHEGPSFWSNTPCTVRSETAHFEAESIWGQKWTVTPDGEPARTFVVWNHYFTADAIATLLAPAGFRVEEIHTGLVRDNAFTSSDVLFIRARKI